VTVSCSSLPPSLIESELFGREKGAYTGALTSMVGRFEAADKATLFLDEIGELPHEVQVKLLRVLEEGEFERLGSSKPHRVDVRIIAATNRDLAKEVKAGRFRSDLYYRLNVFPIALPPLRERLEDIPQLVWTFVRQFEKRMGKRIESVPRRTMDALQRYPWPGNIRELRNVIEYAMITARGQVLEVRVPTMSPAESLGEQPSSAGNLEDIERKHIRNVLQKTGWRISGKGGAAEVLGLKRTTLQFRMKKLGIKRPAN
jgi:formate hydrogenlyase transcriptional activator